MEILQLTVVLILVKQSVDIFSQQSALEFCEYWQYTPLFKELDLGTSCLQAVYYNNKQVRQFKIIFYIHFL